jgi:outer membrane protein assembly factor BamB
MQKRTLSCDWVSGLCALFCLAVGCGFVQAEDWLQFRGPTGDGISAARNLPIRWGGFEGVTWKVEIPGHGWSSPVVVGDRIWLTAAECTALPAAQREQKLLDSIYRENRDQLQIHAAVSCYAIEVAAASGEVLRTIELFTCNDPPTAHASNGYASPTPVASGEFLVCHFGSLGTVCLHRTSGEVIWKQRFLVEEITGPGSSPALANDIVIVPCDGTDQQFVVGLKLQTGEVVWKTPRPPIDDQNGIHRRAFSTPLVTEYEGRKQAIVPGAQWVVSYDPATGKEHWRVSFGDGHAIIPRPVFHDGLVYICTGYLKPRLWAIRVNGSGDVTSTHVVWQHAKQVPEISSPVLVDGNIYFVSSLGIATCLDAKTGEQLWQHRLGGNFAASPLAASGKLYFTSSEGVTTVLEASREYHELAKSELFGQTMASLAVCGEAILIRADRTLYCVGRPTSVP